VDRRWIHLDPLDPPSHRDKNSKQYLIWETIDKLYMLAFRQQQW
jgi:hypothetical protein